MALRVRPQTCPAGGPSSLNLSDIPSEPPDSTDLDRTKGKPPEKAKEEKVKWSLTDDAFNKLLAHFSSDRDEAGVQYELARRKVIRFFEWRAISGAEQHADETMNRVARRIDEGQTIDKLMAYIFGVARVLLKEIDKEPKPVALEDAPASLWEKPPEIVDPDVRVICFDHCLEELGVENRNLLLAYFEGQGRAKIENRRELADQLEIPLNALRIRVHRIKRTLEKCIAACLEKHRTKQLGANRHSV